MAKPSFQFYPGDWLKEPSLSRCSLAAQGAAIRLLCYMHESEPRGVLSWTDDEISAVLGHSDVLGELLAKGVFSRNSDGWVCSRRFVREAQLTEVRAESGRLGGRISKRKAKAKQNVSKPPQGGIKGGLAEAEDEDEDEEKKTGRVRNPIWDAVVAVLFDPATDRQKKRIGRLVSDLKKEGATPDEITARARRYKDRWPTMSFTPEAFGKHWPDLGADQAYRGGRVRAKPGKYDAVPTIRLREGQGPQVDE